MDSATTSRPIAGHQPLRLTTLHERTGMFERDDLLLRERLHELRDAAAARRSRPQDAADVTDGLLDRARRSLGHRLIALGAVVAGAALPAMTDDVPCEDCSVSAA